MNVDVKDRLPCISAVVDNRAVAVFETFLFGYARGDAEEVADEFFVAGLRLIERGYVLARYDEDVRRSLRVDVTKGYGPSVLEDLLSGNLARDDLAEEAALFGHEIQRSPV